MYGVRQLDEGVAKMPQKRRSSRTRKVPTYLQHRPSGRAYCWVYDDEGNRKAVYLGPHDSAESHRRFAEVKETAQMGLDSAAPRPGQTEPWHRSGCRLPYL